MSIASMNFGFAENLTQVGCLVSVERLKSFIIWIKLWLFWLFEITAMVIKSNPNRETPKPNEINFLNICKIYQFYRNTAIIISNIQKHFYQDNLSFVCLQFYKHNCVYILVDNVCFHIQVNNQRKWI